ncbi:MAG: uracil phosphoribosyltransferase [Pseudomonadota bacterium]
MTQFPSLTIVDHPIIQHKLTILRDKTTPSATFRQLLKEIGLLLGYEATRELPLHDVHIETPIEAGAFPGLDEGRLCFVSILRAGNGLLEGLLDLAPSARVSHIGMYRNPETLQPVEYYFKAPAGLGGAVTIMTDPMLATAGTAIAAADKLKSHGARTLIFVCLVAAPEGVAVFSARHPDIPIITAALDERLNAKGYIVPGLGDAGDRIYGTV